MNGHNCLLEKLIEPSSILIPDNFLQLIQDRHPDVHVPEVPKRHPDQMPEADELIPPGMIKLSTPLQHRSQTSPEEVYGCWLHPQFHSFGAYPKIIMSGIFLTCCLHQYTTRQIHAPISCSSIQILVFSYWIALRQIGDLSRMYFLPHGTWDGLQPHPMTLKWISGRQWMDTTFL